MSLGSWGKHIKTVAETFWEMWPRWARPQEEQLEKNGVFQARTVYVKVLESLRRQPAYRIWGKGAKGQRWITRILGPLRGKVQSKMWGGALFLYCVCCCCTKGGRVMRTEWLSLKMFQEEGFLLFWDRTSHGPNWPWIQVSPRPACNWSSCLLGLDIYRHIKAYLVLVMEPKALFTTLGKHTY